MLNDDQKLSDLLSVTVVGADTVSDTSGSYALYVIEVTCKLNGDTWRVHRRFSSFLKLQADLSHMAIPVSLPVGVFASSTSPSIMERRKRLLDEFLAAVLSFPPEVALANDHLSRFLRISDSVLACMGLSLADRDDMSRSFCQSATPPLEDSGILAWLDTQLCMPGRDTQVLTKEVSKLGDDKLRVFLNRLLSQMGEAVDSVPSVSAAEAVALLSHLVSVETNQDASLVIHALVQITEWPSKARLSNFVLCPSTAMTRLHAFRIAEATGLNPEIVFSDSAVEQFIAWQHARCQSAVPQSLQSGEDSMAGSGLAGLFAIGPNSPVARSVNGSGHGGRQQTAAGVAQEAREWVSFAASVGSSDGFTLSGSVKDDWTVVKVPVLSSEAIMGQVEVKFKLSGPALYEIRVEWTFPPSTDMESVITVLWALAGSAPASSPSSEENLLESVECVLNDSRRVGGTAVVQILKSCSRSFDGRKVVLAATTDPKVTTSSHDPLVRRIKHLHYVGCEIDVDKGSVTGCGLLSSESIFLVAGDLLGERLSLWKLLERVSDQVGVGLKGSRISQWLASPRVVFY